MELKDDWEVCTMCNSTRATLRYMKARKGNWFSEATPEYVLVTCSACWYDVRVRPGTITNWRPVK